MQPPSCGTKVLKCPNAAGLLVRGRFNVRQFHKKRVRDKQQVRREGGTVMPGAITMSYDYTDSQDTGEPDDDGLVDDTGDFLQDILGGGTQLLSSILGGAKSKPAQGGGIGEGIGMLAGGALGTLAGGAGSGIGAALGKAAGGAVEKLVRTQTA